jgi:hypothetical protein
MLEYEEHQKAKVSGDCLQVGREREGHRDRLVLRAPQGSRLKGGIRGHLDPLARLEHLEVLESEVPLDPKDCKDFQACKYVTHSMPGSHAFCWHQCQHETLSFLNSPLKVRNRDRDQEKAGKNTGACKGQFDNYCSPHP